MVIVIALLGEYILLGKDLRFSFITANERRKHLKIVDDFLFANRF